MKYIVLTEYGKINADIVVNANAIVMLKKINQDPDSYVVVTTTNGMLYVRESVEVIITRITEALRGE